MEEEWGVKAVVALLLALGVHGVAWKRGWLVVVAVVCQEVRDDGVLRILKSMLLVQTQPRKQVSDSTFPFAEV